MDQDVPIDPAQKKALSDEGWELNCALRAAQRALEAASRLKKSSSVCSRRVICRPKQAEMAMAAMPVLKTVLGPGGGLSTQAEEPTSMISGGMAMAGLLGGAAGAAAGKVAVA
eukprot:Skav230771  [mRNA]  locus=scaffold1473:74873:80716:- [translate_table: standard]